MRYSRTLRRGGCMTALGWKQLRGKPALDLEVFPLVGEMAASSLNYLVAETCLEAVSSWDLSYNYIVSSVVEPPYFD